VVIHEFLVKNMISQPQEELVLKPKKAKLSGKFKKKARKMAEKAIISNFSLNLMNNAKYKNKEFLKTLIACSVEQDSLENFTDDVKCPNADTIFHHLEKMQIKVIEDMFSDCLASVFKLAKNKMLFRDVYVAIDTNKIPYYGNPNGLPEKFRKYIRAEHDLPGTKWAFVYATMSIVENGKRFVIAVLPMIMHMTKEEVVRKVMEKVPKFVKIKLVLMDRWFFADNVFTYLESIGNYFLTPATEYPSIKDLIRDNPKRPCVIEEHSMGECNAKFKIILIEEFNEKEKKYEVQGFATNLELPDEKDYFELPKTYSKRWGIETSYRVVKNFRIETCTTKYQARLFFVLLSYCLYNIWVIMNLIIEIECFGAFTKKPVITAKKFCKALRNELLIEIPEILEHQNMQGMKYAM
jgi:hypothetical protein